MLQQAPDAMTLLALPDAQTLNRKAAAAAADNNMTSSVHALQHDRNNAKYKNSGAAAMDPLTATGASYSSSAIAGEVLPVQATQQQAIVLQQNNLSLAFYGSLVHDHATIGTTNAKVAETATTGNVKPNAPLDPTTSVGPGVPGSHLHSTRSFLEHLFRLEPNPQCLVDELLAAVAQGSIWQQVVQVPETMCDSAAVDGGVQHVVGDEAGASELKVWCSTAPPGPGALGQANLNSSTVRQPVPQEHNSAGLKWDGNSRSRLHLAEIAEVDSNCSSKSLNTAAAMHHSCTPVQRAPLSVRYGSAGSHSEGHLCVR